MTAIAAAAAARIHAITALLTDVSGPAKLPAPAGPETPICVSCSRADRLLISTGYGTYVCLNVDRCLE